MRRVDWKQRSNAYQTKSVPWYAPGTVRIIFETFYYCFVAAWLWLGYSAMTEAIVKQRCEAS